MSYESQNQKADYVSHGDWKQKIEGDLQDTRDHL